ncbi:MAG: NAD(P)-dependent glycerol-3-phosphate dehydrogenase [Acidobacteria bacterium]|nr:NAD(P)-dependent glycerol-3-phosphate dehydrogenase [Acidobacteriota bacterium]
MSSGSGAADRVAVLGSGGWGTALAVHLARLGKPVGLWGREPSLVAEMSARRENRRYLRGVSLPPGVEPTTSLGSALGGARYVVAAVPSHGVREVLRRAAPSVPPQAIIVSAAKGIEEGTLLRMSEVIEQELGTARPVTVLSGPSFAAEVARGAPTAVLVAGRASDAVGAVQHEFRSGYFRLYASDDVTGVEVGAALKNVIAIAAGVVDGLGLGHNATAALITRGLAEVSRLAYALGGRRDTLAGLSGLGDLVLTCTGALSRNRQVGLGLGAGRPLDEVLAGMSAVAEGVRTTGAALALGDRHGVELPIAAQMAEVLSGRRTPRAALEELMLRRQRSEAEP